MDTSTARDHLTTASHLLREKAGERAKDTAAGQLILAITALCEELDTVFATPEPPAREPGVYSAKPDYGRYTAPFRYQREQYDGILAGISARELARDVD